LVKAVSGDGRHAHIIAKVALVMVRHLERRSAAEPVARPVGISPGIVIGSIVGV
jgi:hypothetical protein